jgi:hypothetical protein
MDDKSRPEREAQILAELEKLGVDTQKYLVQFLYDKKVGDWRYPITVTSDGNMSISGDAMKEMLDAHVPYAEQWLDRVFDRLAQATRDAPTPAPKDTLARFKAHIPYLSNIQAKDPALVGDALLSTLIANLAEAYQTVEERVLQLTHIEPPEATQDPGRLETLGLLGLKEIAVSILLDCRDLLDAMPEDNALWDELRDDIRKVPNALNAAMDRIKKLKTEPSELL